MKEENKRSLTLSRETSKQLIFDSIMELYYETEGLTKKQIGDKLYMVLDNLDKIDKPVMDDELLTVKEVSQILKCNVHKVYELIQLGLLPGLKLGSLKIRRVSLMRFLADNDGMDMTDLQDVKKLNNSEIMSK